ncbi:helix-turn-helix domain-containing protein [Bifidobacterium callitrichidarum]|uniref:HTH cro/C1-type domain-containing protein n=1 Tax=Bifidobacterium callitrichidarum TaxID=2052941 RepID=A0A2U2NC85_9BIFI|nr:helix-turn-helix transcriptional regulator [Bifidobacterium callitrichidarum]PWG66644.1 hypothetical protein DF196_01715 [Bifidobacterium callitrichidarum]
MFDINESLRILSGNIVKYRKLAGLSQQDLADDMGVTQAQISRWENLPGHTPPSYENLLKLSDILGEPVAHLTGDMKAHDYSTQDAADYLGLDPTAVTAIRDAAGFQSDGSRDPLDDYSKALSALLLIINPEELLTHFDQLIQASWGAEQTDNPRKADKEWQKAVSDSNSARFLIWSALDKELRENFPVTKEMFFSPEALKQEKIRRHNRFEALKTDLDGMDDSTRHETLEITSRIFSEYANQLSRMKTDMEDAKKRIAESYRR